MEDENLFAFVLMPFDKAFDDIYRMGIKETAAMLDIRAERVDEQIFQEGILDRIYRQITASDIVIADMTGQNANVFYEVGFAHAKDKLCILLTQDPNDIPFDLKHHRHIVYGKSISTLREMLSKDLLWAKAEIENVRASHIKVALKSADGLLEKSNWAAKGKVSFKIDLLNNSSKPSADIEAVYFYSGAGWTLKQGESDCPSTDSDIPEFKTRHFINPPIRKLLKNSWAQIKFTSTKYLAFAAEGEELKDSYKVTGKAVLRLVTSEGNFDYAINIDTECNEFPF